MAALFAALSLAFWLVAAWSAAAGQWVIAVAAAALASWIGTLAWTALRRTRL